MWEAFGGIVGVMVLSGVLAVVALALTRSGPRTRTNTFHAAPPEGTSQPASRMNETAYGQAGKGNSRESDDNNRGHELIGKGQ
jgi:hypothetical protein